MLTRRNAVLGAGLAALGLAGCSGGGDDARGSDDGPLTIGYMPSWTDSVVMAFLLQNRLEALGYVVDLASLNNAAVAFVALDEGDIDVYASTWPDVTHAPYIQQYGDDLEDLGTYGDFARAMLAVPEYTGISSLEELAAMPGRFDGTIYGIEPGAGIVTTVSDEVLPAYGLAEEYQVVTSSTPAMLSELQKASTEHQDVLVTMWEPHRVEQAVDTKGLADPLGAFDNPETLHVTGRGGFGEDFPDAAEYIGQVRLAEEEYTQLEQLVVDEYEGDEEEAIEVWLEDNPDVLPDAGTG